MDFISTSQKINTLVNQANKILLVVHQQPDADALGCLAVFSEWLDSLGKQYDSFCKTLPATNLLFLYNAENLKINPEQLVDNRYDLVVIFDSGDLKYAGVDDLIPRFSPSPVIVSIDHHVTNQYFGQVNLIDATAASATEILFRFFKAINVKLSPQMASAILAGIVGDTYNFTNPNTTQTSLGITAKLLINGAKLTAISNSVAHNKELVDLKVWGRALLRLRLNRQFNIAITVVTPADLGPDAEFTNITDGIANFLNSLSGVAATLILRQDDEGIIKGSLRTGDDLIDVSKLATILGGGGHKKAAGFKLNGRLVEANDGSWQVI